MSASLLLDLFQKYLEISAVFDLSPAENPTIGNENVLLDFFFFFFDGGGGEIGENSTNKVLLLVSAERMKICSYFQVENNLQDVS